MADSGAGQYNQCGVGNSSLQPRPVGETFSLAGQHLRARLRFRQMPVRFMLTDCATLNNAVQAFQTPPYPDGIDWI